jgi:hypothetical protein|nr:MAG TPA: hypothetical protein [Caudoviricetes sp.]
MEIKNTSKYFTELVESMQQEYNDLETSIIKQHNSYDKKLEIMNAVLEYGNYLNNQMSRYIDSLKDGNRINETIFDGETVLRKNIYNSNKILFADTNKVLEANSNYEKYGNCIHPKIIGNLDNLLNFNSAAGYIFKNSATVSINEEVKEEYIDVLKHDTILNKMPTFSQYSSDTVTLTIEFPDNPIVGSATCNAIEISPFLAGASILKNITIITTPGTQLTNKAIVIDYDQPLEDTRILFDNTYSIKTMVLNFKLTFVNNLGMYPFGLRHIYLYNANFDTKNSNIVIKNEYQNLIKYINDNIVISDQTADEVGNRYSKHNTTCSEMDIKLYSYLSNGNLLYPIETHARDIINQISRNTKVFYADIPVKKAMYSIEFSKVRT